MRPKELSDTNLPGFEPKDPWASEDLVLKRRNLPHLEVPGATYFVTFRCRSHINLPPDARDRVMAAIQACDRESIDLDAAVVMPDHVHAIFRLIEGHSLSRVLQAVKGLSAAQVNRILRQRGPVWMDESFDHIIRNASDLEEKIEYIKRNPVEAGLVTPPAAIGATDYRWLFLRSFTG